MTRQPLLNIAELIDDPDFCQDFKVIRRLGSWDLGRFVTTEETLDTFGIIDPEPFKEMQFDPNGVLLTGIIKVYTYTPLYTTQKNKTNSQEYNSDLIVWQDNHYLVLDETNYSDYGYRAYTCQLKEADGINEYQHQ